MKFIRSKLVLLAMASVAVPSMAGDIDGANVRNCTWCHGVSGQGYFTAPRLAGQKDQYIENQLSNFSGHRRDNPLSKQYMWNAVAALNPQAARDLANYFSSLPPKAAEDGDKQLEAAGKTIFEEGIPDSNIVACIVCHGPNAEGVRDIPRLGGLTYYYLKRRLAEWGEGYHLSAAPPMPRIASKLSSNDIDALASYLSFVK